MKESIDPATQKNIDSWLTAEYDAASKREIEELKKKNPQELIDAFYTHLTFGTGGLRGIMGVGTNRMNVYTVRAATQGLAHYIHKQKSKEQKSVLIGYDCRHHSREFAEEAAKVLAANGIEVFLYNEIKPVALVSFGVLYKQCIAGILITASHNPPKYNGYKVYWSYGGQALPPHDRGIIEEVNRITKPSMVQMVSLPHPRVHEVDGEIQQAYLQTIDRWQLYRQDNLEKGKELHIVYSNLHGAGIVVIPEALRKWGFTQLTVVKEQEKPDGAFPTVKSPNPEEHEALTLGVKYLQNLQADLFFATDPDTDRIGVVVLHEKQPFFFNGNEMASILLEHILDALKKKNMPPRPICVKTFVTTELFKAIAEGHAVPCIDVLTGFKYIGEKIAAWEREEEGPHFIFGGEESYGYLLGTHVRDKDAIISAVCIAETALQAKLKGKTLVDLLYALYQKYGVYREKLLSLTFEGKEGIDTIHAMMERLRKEPPQTVGELLVIQIEDYLHSSSLPKSDVLRLYLENETKLVIRPSGTEPKIKIYCGVKGKIVGNRLQEAIQEADARAELLLKSLKQHLLETAGRA